MDPTQYERMEEATWTMRHSRSWRVFLTRSVSRILSTVCSGRSRAMMRPRRPAWHGAAAAAPPMGMRTPATVMTVVRAWAVGWLGEPGRSAGALERSPDGDASTVLERLEWRQQSPVARARLLS